MELRETRPPSYARLAPAGDAGKFMAFQHRTCARGHGDQDVGDDTQTSLVLSGDILHSDES
jgi:hypothetical protein